MGANFKRIAQMFWAAICAREIVSRGGVISSTNSSLRPRLVLPDRGDKLSPEAADPVLTLRWRRPAPAEPPSLSKTR